MRNRLFVIGLILLLSTIFYNCSKDKRKIGEGVFYQNTEIPGNIYMCYWEHEVVYWIFNSEEFQAQYEDGIVTATSTSAKNACWKLMFYDFTESDVKIRILNWDGTYIDNNLSSGSVGALMAIKTAYELKDRAK